MRKITDAIRERLGPVGLSLLAAAVTAVAFATVSVAQDDGDGANRGDRSELRGPGGPMLKGLSEADREQLETFRQCMEDEGAPAPPRFRGGDGPPEPPSEEEIERIREAHESCQEELPEQLRDRGFPPRLRHGPCGPPPGIERGDRGQREDGDGENQEQGYVIPAPALPEGAIS